jgi:uncharacterized protein DUF6188
MSSELGSASALLAYWIGSTCEVARSPHQWRASFGQAGSLSVEAPWRIVADGGIACCSSDDGEQFGLPAPLDAEAEARRLLADKRVTGVAVAELTGDLTISFGDDTRFQVLNTSSGYEAWQASTNEPGRYVRLVAAGGGKIAIWDQPA